MFRGITLWAGAAVSLIILCHPIVSNADDQFHAVDKVDDSFKCTSRPPVEFTSKVNKVRFSSSSVFKADAEM